MGLLSRLGKGTPRPPLGPPTYSNEAVTTRIEREHRVDGSTARAWFGEMLIFLDLCARSKDLLAPPPDVDKAWHAFLLHSRDYAAYCQERFGRTIWHDPTDEPDPEAYRRAYRRRLRYDPVHDPAVWAVPVGFVAGSEADDDDDEREGHSGAGNGGGDVDFGGDSDGASDGGSSCGGGGCGGGGS